MEIIKIIGTIGELFYLSGLIMLLIPNNKIDVFFKRHKKCTKFFIIMCAIGFIKFIIFMMFLWKG